MYQQSLDLQFPLTQQLSFGFPHEKNLTTLSSCFVPRIDSQLSIIGIGTTTPETQLEVNNNGLYIRQENKSWLKTKVANWLGVQYL